MNGRAFRKIEVALWCKTHQVALGWLPFLRAGVVLNAEGRLFCIRGLATYCETARTVSLQYEDQLNEAGTTSRSFYTAVPGVEDPTTASMWDPQHNSLRVYEIVKLLLGWNFSETQKTWALEGS
jgi:hypothetical protein